MEFYSLNNPGHRTHFREAVIRGLAPDRGLYFPSKIPTLPASFFNTIEAQENIAIAREAISPFVGDAIPNVTLSEILADTLSFDIPLIPLTDSLSVMELYHGPTMAFKDVGARFMARCLGHFFKNEDKAITVLVATSGDTGGAVARGFLGVPGVEVVILYPAGKVSDIQEAQLTTLGQNITALKVDSTFDTCQDMVKSAFLDAEISGRYALTSANSINIARWLPQMFYYLLAYKQLPQKDREWVISVPSGNFGNLCAGMLAHKMGMPCKHFIASTNINDTIPVFLETGTYEAKPSQATISNAMDVGDPSNFVRILELYDQNFEQLAHMLSGASFTDNETRDGMRELKRNFDYVADPHGAVGYLGLKGFLQDNPKYYGTFLETAHPAKFRAEVETTLDLTLHLPPQLQSVLGKPKEVTPIRDYADFKAFMMRRN